MGPDRLSLHAEGKWVFSRRADYFLFLLIPLVAVFIYLRFIPETAKGRHSVDFFPLVVVDAAHIYATLFVSYFSAYHLKKYWNSFTYIPVAIVLASVTLLLLFPEVFFSVLPMIILFHVGRQQIGWLALTKQRLTEPSWRSNFDRGFIYICCYASFVSVYASDFQNNYYAYPGDFLRLPHWLGPVTLALASIYMGVFLYLELISFLRLKKISEPRTLILTSTFLFWVVPLIFFKDVEMFDFVIILLHGIPYILFSFKTGYKLNGSVLKIKNYAPSFVAGLFMIFVLAFTEVHINSFIAVDPVPTLQKFNGLIPRLSTIALLLVVWLPSLSHYIFDGIIWRFSRDSKLRATITA